jgi:hypothetical protein
MPALPDDGDPEYDLPSGADCPVLAAKVVTNLAPDES